MLLKNPKLRRALRGGFVVFMLSVVITGCGSGSQAEAESESEAPANISLDQLLDMSTAAGLDCASFTEWSDADVMGGRVTEMGTCNPNETSRLS